jgi:RNA polymerase sigma factor (sigma-70 family)
LDSEDRSLLDRIAGGGREALRRFYERHAPGLFRFALARLGDPYGAEDVVQETMLSVWQGARSFKGASRVTTWLFGICRNKVGDRLRGRETPTAPESRMAEAGWQDRPEPASMDFWTAFRTLSEDHQEVILLAFHYGFSREEMAAILGVPVGTVKSRTHHARRLLRELLDKGCGQGGRGRVG